jgi:NAD(P)-dependent dehydrogenase (short-subunit alcohol dehydrogenase family)
VRSLARSFTAELKNCKIRVNVVSPGRIDTPAASVAISGLQASQEPVKVGVVDSIPLGRMGTPDEIANAVLFLASDDSSFVTGIELFVDGGRAQVWSYKMVTGASNIDTLVKEKDRIDVVVNNAGYDLMGALEDTSLDEIKAQFETNLFGAVRVMQSVIPYHEKTGRKKEMAKPYNP